MRIAAVHLPGLRAELARARRARAGETSAVVTDAEVKRALESVAESALAFGRTASIDLERDVVGLDVTGCGHLFGGEAALARALSHRVLALHFGEARVCVADGPRVSAALARGMRKGELAIVPPGGNAAAIRALPVRALPIDERTIEWLERLGLGRVADLQKLPPRSLSVRLGAAHAEIAALLAGDDAAPLAPYVPKEVPEERAELEYGVDKSEALVFVAKTLCDRLEARLAGRALGVTRLELELSLDRALLPDSSGSARPALSLTSPAPLSLASEMLSLVRVKLESWTLEAPVLAVTLRAASLASKETRALDLFEPVAKAEVALPRLVAELAAEIGEGNVGTLGLADVWTPESRSLLRPLGSSEPARATIAPLVSLGPEPSRILPRAAALSESAGECSHARHLYRVEASEWWRSGVRCHGSGRDFFAAWIAQGARWAWVEVDALSGMARLRGWFD